MQNNERVNGSHISSRIFAGFAQQWLYITGKHSKQKVNDAYAKTFPRTTLDKVVIPEVVAPVLHERGITSDAPTSE